VTGYVSAGNAGGDCLKTQPEFGDPQPMKHTQAPSPALIHERRCIPYRSTYGKHLQGLQLGSSKLVWSDSSNTLSTYVPASTAGSAQVLLDEAVQAARVAAAEVSCMDMSVLSHTYQEAEKWQCSAWLGWVEWWKGSTCQAAQTRSAPC
jgi:hypothetical protein